jgi:predicted ferric reductase
MFNISYDTFNLFHRWLGRIVGLEILVHISAWLSNTVRAGDWKGAMWVINQAASYKWGLMASIAFLLLLLHTWSPLRHAFYETFALSHRILYIHAFIGVYWHLRQHALPQLPWTYIFISILAADYLLRISRIVYYNTSGFSRDRTITRTTIEALPGEACRLSFNITRPWTAKPGAHVHIYLPAISFLCSHPFSVAWFESQPVASSDEKLPSNSTDLDARSPNSTISLIVRARTGMTRSLYRKASLQPNSTLTTWGAIEGPYGGLHSLNSYGTVVLFAGGIGITHQLTFVRHLLKGHTAGTGAAMRILLVWSIRSTDMLDWVRRWLEEIMAMQDREAVLQVLVFFTGKRADEIDKSYFPRGVDVRPGRCNAEEVVDAEVRNQIGAMMVTVCGPGAFADMVRGAVRKRVGMKNIDFVEEAFTY